MFVLPYKRHSVSCLYCRTKGILFHVCIAVQKAFCFMFVFNMVESKQNFAQMKQEQTFTLLYTHTTKQIKVRAEVIEVVRSSNISE